MLGSPSDHVGQIERLRREDVKGLTELYDHYRDRLRRMVELRIDARLQGRLDASDILQDAFIDAAVQLKGYLREPKFPVFIWLRLTVRTRLAMVHRQHLGTKMREVGREVSIYRDPLPLASSAALASMLIGRATSPTFAAVRAEQLLIVQQALNTLEPIDREVITLRHFEQLSRVETAQELAISEEAGAKRYIRALKRLKAILQEHPGILEDF